MIADPLWSCVMLLCGPLWVLCGPLRSFAVLCGPLRSFAVFSHTPFNGPFSGITQVSRYQKGKTNLDFTEARDSEWQWHQLDICKSAPHSRQITTPAPHRSVFYRPDALPASQVIIKLCVQHVSGMSRTLSVRHRPVADL